MKLSDSDIIVLTMLVGDARKSYAGMWLDNNRRKHLDDLLVKFVNEREKRFNKVKKEIEK